MKKLFSFLSILTIISPVLADDPVPVAGTPAHADSAVLAKDGSNNTIQPGYALANGHDTDVNAASAGYVKGAYNATIKAVNTLNSIKQDKLTSENGGNVLQSGTGPVVTGISAADGVVTVAKGQVTIPYGSASSSTQAAIWIQ